MRNSQDLNARQRKFVDRWLVHRNATRAAREAGYSEKSAGQQGHALLRNPKVKGAIEDRQLELRENAPHELTPEAVRDQLWIEGRGLGIDTSPGARVSALVHLTKVLGMVTERRLQELEVRAPDLDLEELIADEGTLELLDQIAIRQEEAAARKREARGGNGRRRRR